MWVLPHNNCVPGEREVSPRAQSETIDVFSQEASEAIARLPKEIETQLRERVGIRLRECAFLFDPDRIARMSLLSAVGELETFPPDLVTEEWMDERIDRSVRLAILQDVEDELDGVAIDPEDSSFEFAAETLGVPLEMTRGSVVRFNALDYPARKAFIETAVAGKRVRDSVEAGLGSLEEYLNHLRQALIALGMIAERPSTDDSGGEE